MAFGEAKPRDLYYGRAEVFGDHFTVWAEIDPGHRGVEECYPENAHGKITAIDWGLVGTRFCNELDTLEGHSDALSKEVSITSSAYGDFLYAAWGQFNVDSSGLFVNGNAMFRRVWYLDEYISSDNAWLWDLP